MLKLPTNAGEWGFVIVLSLLFCGLAFAIIYSQIELHGIKEQQARRDTESTLRMFAARVRQYRKDHGKLENKLTAMGVNQDELETRHAIFEDVLALDHGRARLKGTLKKYGKLTFTAEFDPATDSPVEISESPTP